MEVVSLERRKDGMKIGMEERGNDGRKEGMNDGHKELGGGKEGGEGC